MRVAFYAPLKPVDHPVPSGDRLVARMLCDALGNAGFDVDIAARLRSRVADGNILKQVRLAELGTKLAARLLRQYQSGYRKRPDIWFTYHLYYKAPDWIGPIVAHALGIPYVLAEASFAPKRAAGPWGQSHAAVTLALKQADAVFSLNQADMVCLKSICPPDRLHFLPPFTQIENWQSDTPRTAPDPSCVRLVTTAMMRDGDKLKSYDMLADVLGRLIDRGITNWSCTIIGDGPARDAVQRLFSNMGIPDKNVTFAGLCTPEQTRSLLAQSDLFVWPAIREAFGMAMLEAQATGLPVLAGDAGGVSGIVTDGKTGWLTPEGDEDAFLNRLAHCLTDDLGLLRAMGQAAQQKAQQEHSLDAASNLLGTILRGLTCADDHILTDRERS
ncbi:glycosyltransferase family 4 protein [Thalassospira sp. MA62]|nr:glycosyltransferase family 4 protein [Thalassospira sp. MA62]